MSTSIKVRPVSGKADLKAFLDVPFTIYRGDPNWVAPLYLERLDHLNPRKNPYFRHADAQLFVAERDGMPVGRISAQFDRLRNDRYKDDSGQFGFLEAPDDAAVFAALFAAASDWLKGHGAKSVQGPFSFSINDETGCLVAGFDRPPSMMMGHARPYYDQRIAQQDFVKVKDVIAYEMDRTTALPRAMQSMFNRAMSDPDVAVRPLEKKHLARDLSIIIDIFNDAWSENWGFVPFTADEIAKLGNDLKMLVAEGYIAIASYRGTPAAMAVTLPNLNDWIAGLNGRLLPFGLPKLLWRMLSRHPRSVRMPLMGVRRVHHGTAIGSALGIAVIETLRRYHLEKGTEQAELSWILEDNMPMRRLIEQIGAKPYKTYRVYQKALT